MTMPRRDFVKTVLGGSAALAFGAHAAETTSDPVFAAFLAERARSPWTMGFAGLQADVEPMVLQVEGKLPAGLNGAFFRNGPARHQLGGMRYHHWFDGDGLVQKYQIAGGRITHRGRFVRTDKFVADSAAGRFVRAAFDTNPPGAQPVGSPDAINVANTSVVDHGGELLALWEGGSATRVDADTLETKGFKAWSDDYAGMPFSAHPKIEPDGTMWNFGVFSMRSMLSIYRIKPDGELAQAVTMAVPKIAMVHDFVVTERHLVLLLPPLVFDAERAKAGQTFLHSHVWQPELGLRVLVLAKDALDKPQWFTLPAGFVFHLGNAWEDGSTIRLDCMRAPDAWQAMSGLEQVMQGRFVDHEFARPMVVEIDLAAGRARQNALPHFAEFPRVDPRVVGRRYRALFAAERVDAGERPGYDAVMRVDPETGRHQRYRYGADVMVEEHVFVPRGPREGDGWLVGSALDLKRRQMLLSVFDAEHLADGPLAQGRMDRVMPLGLHAIFVPA